MNKKNRHLSLTALLISSVFAIVCTLAPTPAFAATSHIFNAGGGVGAEIEKETGLGNTNVSSATGTVINILLGLLGVLVTILMLYGGIIWMSANGNDEKIDQAKKMIIGGIIGLFIVFLSASLARLLIRSAASASKSNVTGVEANTTKESSDESSSESDSESEESGFGAGVQWGEKEKTVGDDEFE